MQRPLVERAAQGLTPDLQERLSTAGAFVLSSRFEGFPMVLIEAMSAATPVVSYDCPTGPAEMVTDGVDGLLVRPRSVPGLADALSRLLADPEQRQRLGAAGRARVDELSLANVATRWESMLAGLPGAALAASELDLLSACPEVDRSPGGASDSVNSVDVGPPAGAQRPPDGSPRLGCGDADRDLEPRGPVVPGASAHPRERRL